VRRAALASALVALALLGCSLAPPEPPPVRVRASATATRAVVPTRPPDTSRPATAAPKPPGVQLTVGAPSDNTRRGWGFKPNKAHKTPDVGSAARKMVAKYGAAYVGDTSSKVVYLTFDEGYENGNTPAILDTLKSKDVKAAFFVTGTYCRDDPAPVRRMVDEGHVVGSHSWSHPSMPTKAASEAAFDREFTKTEAAFEKATGRPIARFFRPPSGDYSALSLWRTARLGYRTVFWSFAHVDYDETKQPPVDVTVRRVLDGSHPGAILLLHAISTSDTKALPAIIDGLRTQGYRFGSPDELPK
jgi:peptidoglycan-N-acetylmuramic acid deacetylase